MEWFVMLNQVVHVVTTVILKVNDLVIIKHEGPASPVRNSATGKKRSTSSVQFSSSQIIYLENST